MADQEHTDDEIHRLPHLVIHQVGQADPPYPIQVGVEVALLARYYERFADQAVTVSKQLDYTATGHKTPLTPVTTSTPGTR